MLRQQKYKELAAVAITLLNKLSQDAHEVHHLLAQSYYNSWEYTPALKHIDLAVARLPKGSHLYAPYRRLEREILTKKRFFREPP